MSHFFENSSLQIEINPQLARWTVSARHANSARLEDLQLNLGFRRGRHYKNLLDRWLDFVISEDQVANSPHGPGNLISIEVVSSKEALKSTITYFLPQDHPLLLWKLSVRNQGDQPIHIESMEILSAGYIHQGRKGPNGRINFPAASRSKPRTSYSSRSSSHPLNLAFFSNGWQSWSRTGSYRATDQYLQTKLGFLRAPLVKNSQTPNPHRRGMFASDMFGVLGDHVSRRGVMIGFLSQMNHFGSLEAWLGGMSPALKMWANGDSARLDPGTVVETDWACLHFMHLDQPDPLAPYLEAVAREHDLSQANLADMQSPTGWCSWYQFMSEDYVGDLSAEDIVNNIRAISELKQHIPIDIIQIDDGFQTQIGDWLSFNQGFSDGLSPLAKEIQDHGFSPGLWLAPFILHPKSNLALENRDWILRNRFGRPVNAGFLWNTFTRALDITHPEAVDYIREVIYSAAHDWGFNYLKLDFLYAAALPGKFHDATKSRAQVLRAGLEMVREAAGDETFLLGCGCPLGPAIGLVDAMRIGADTARRWNPYFKGIESFLKKEASFPSAFNSVHNALTRSDLHRRWWINDPDCLLLRPETQLTKTEVESIASVIALTGGSLIISDHVPGLPQDRINILKSLLPVIGERPHILDWFDSTTPRRIQLDLDGPIGPWHLVALFNWEDSAQDIVMRMCDLYLESGDEMVASEFWSGRIYQLPHAKAELQKLVFEQVPAHGVVVLAIRKHFATRPQYLGGTLHISQGSEVSRWQPGDKNVKFELQRPGPSQGDIILSVPGQIVSASLNQARLSWQPVENSIYSFHLDFNHQANIEITYS